MIGGMEAAGTYSSLLGLVKVAGPYAPFFGALVPLRLCRAKACPEDYYMSLQLPCPQSIHRPLQDWLNFTSFYQSMILRLKIDNEEPDTK